ncbi:MAG: response regulator [Nanoarchaeota archaeon]|nr:response regulator [Nanoarchaeota archaeon]MBU1321638.1 response regulator [Nanoarchaeota archaeon]MBU1597422.1 response regulator [Nanoarchaeota archaeon]MBU2440915.1 response regulator [Nanoarchaeota archaeon]
MTLDEKLKKIDIERILVVDDASENIEAAKQYFASLEKEGIQVDYAQSAQEAKQKIQEAFGENQRYKLILSDLEMEDKKSGLEVVREGFKHFGFGIIVTGRNYHVPDDHHHGPMTHLEPDIGFVNGRKSKPEVWAQVAQKAIDYLSEGEGKNTFASLKKVGKFIPAPVDGIADSMMLLYFKLEKD